MSVRSAVLNTLLTFLSMQDVEEWVDDRIFRLAFQNMIVEEKRVSMLVIKENNIINNSKIYQHFLQGILSLSIKLWSSLLSHASFNPARITHLTAPHVHSWFSIVMTPLGTPIDRRLLFIADGQALTDKVDAVSTAPPRRGRRTNAGQPNESDSGLVHNIDVGMLQQDFALVSVETVIRGRIASSKALGMLISRWPSEVCTFEQAY